MKQLFLTITTLLLSATTWAGPCSHIEDSELFDGTIEKNATCGSGYSLNETCLVEVDANYMEQLIGTDSAVCGHELVNSHKTVIFFMGWPQYGDQ